jgi:DNA-binding NtrC family response regulator
MRPVGGWKEIPLNLRVVVATSVSLADQLEKGSFREDLYYRINVVNIRVPPLRERKSDIVPLAQRFCRETAQEMHIENKLLGEELERALLRYNWPGNVRQLRNVMKRAVALASDEVLGLGDLPKEVACAPPNGDRPGYFVQRERHLFEFADRYLRELLQRHGGHVRGAASEAELPCGTFYRFLKKHSINPQVFRSCK